MSLVVPSPAPAPVVAGGTGTEERYWEFFAGCLRNRHTRRAYRRAVEDFLVFMESRGVGTLAEIRPLHVAAHIELLSRSHATASRRDRYHGTVAAQVARHRQVIIGDTGDTGHSFRVHVIFRERMA